MNILVFEDEQVNDLYPVTTGRVAFAITVASWRLLDWLEILGGHLSAVVRPHLREMLHADFPSVNRSSDPARKMTLAVNARCVPGQTTLAELKRLANSFESCLAIGSDGSVAAAVLPTADAIRVFAEPSCLSSVILEALSNLPPTGKAIPVLEYPHDLVRHNLAHFPGNLEHRLATGDYREISDGVFVTGEVAISDFVVTNTLGGPILIGEGTVIGPFCFLRGPLYIGAGSRINEYSSIKDSVSIGHTCKIGGEVEGSVIESFTNKQHHGFLGHSYLGSWINLGAGTCNSDLKNTYGEVKIDYRGERVATGMQFIGCIMGDYSKTAINTSIFTGKTIGVCSMLYGFVTTNVPSFSNYARTFSQVTESPPGVMELTQKRMFARRNVQQRRLDIDLLHAMYDLTRHERQLSEEPLNL